MEDAIDEQHKSDELLARRLSTTNEKCPYCGHLEGQAKEYCELCLLRLETESGEKEKEKGKEGRKKETPVKRSSFVIEVENLVGGGRSERAHGVGAGAGQGSGAECKWYQRIWQFDFVPFGFFGRLIVRALGQSNITVYI